MSTDTLPETLPAAHAMIQQLQWRVSQLEKQLYGPSSDRVLTSETFSKEQILLSLFPPPAEPPAVSEVSVAGLPASAEQITPRKPARNPAARVLETVTERIEPQEKLCPHCGKEKCEISCEKSERYEYVPAKIIRHEIVRPNLACPCGQGTVSIAPLPPTVVDKGYPAASLVAQVVLSKYEDHLPLYRQVQQFGRLGVNFSRQMLCDWVEKAAWWCQPIVAQMKQELV